ncbi:MAG: hypothetical protein WCS65_00740 [Verrucomicrobiae bacterium]
MGFFSRSLWVLVAFCAAAGASRAQQSNDPTLAYVYPAGGKKGSSLDVAVGGQRLEKMTGAIVSGAGVQAVVTGFSRPLPGKRFQEFREAIAERRKEIMDSMPPGGGKKLPKEDIAEILQEDGATAEEIRLFRIMQNQKNDPKRQENNQLVETVTVRLDIAADAAKGPRSLRLFGKNGLSNPLAIFVGDFPEERLPGSLEPPLPALPTIRFPVVLNGQILPGQSNRYLFHATMGDKLLFVAQARDLMPYLADAVPGWFQAVLTIFAADGREVASAQSDRFSPDPLLVFDVKESGDFQLEIRDALHRGREDFVYRITAGRIPFVTGIFPLGGSSTSATAVEVSGWNLSRQSLSAQVPPGEGIQRVPLLANGFATADVSFAHDTLAETFAAEPDNDTAHAALLAVPTAVNGRIELPGDVDIFAVKCKKGEPLALEVFARRLNSPLDSYLRITDASGRQLAYNDDQDDIGSGWLTHHADSRLWFDPPATGLFYVHLGDAQRQGGKEFSYRLLIGRPRPDFALRVAPSGITGTPGSFAPITVYALRKDGFSGDISLSASPAGFSLSGGCIPGGRDSVPVTLKFPAAPIGDPQIIGAPQTVEITGTAEISGVEVSRKAVPADDKLQAFFFHHLVPAPDLLAYAPPDRPPKKPIQVAPGTISISPSLPGHATVLLPKSFQKAGMKAELKNPPDGITIEGVAPCEDGVEISFRADVEKIKPGARGNLMVELSAVQPPGKNDKPPGEKPPGEKRWFMGLLPAVPFEILKD